MEYTRNFGSQFPDKVMNLRTFKDVDATALSLVNQIKKLQNAGDFKNASLLIEQNKEFLDNYILSAEYLNFLDEETRNIEIFAKGNSQSTYYQDIVPSNISSKNDVWIGV